MRLPKCFFYNLLSVAILMLFSIAINAAEPLRIAVAANFNATLQKLTATYQQQHDQAFVISAGSSGALYAQIQQAAPFDVFFSADVMRPERLVAENLAIADSRMTYAVGVAVLWSGDPNLIDAKAEVLRSGTFRHLSIAEPRNAPYGVAAQQILEKLGLWQQLNAEKRLIRAQSIGQAYSQVASGAAPLGFVALAQVIDKNGTMPGSYWLAPADMYQPIVQQAVILNYAQRDAATLAAAHSFLAWLQSDAATAIIRQAGYGVE